MTLREIDTRIQNGVVTHGGTFHADDVFSTALVTLYATKHLNVGVAAARVFKVDEYMSNNCLVYDIGLGEFDHHQLDNEVRENGVPYAAFGKLWRVLGPTMVDPSMVSSFDEHFVQPIDAHDNGVGEINQLSSVIGAFNPLWNNVIEQPDSMFDQAVNLAMYILEREFKVAEAVSEAKAIVDEAASKATEDGIIVFDKYCPWMEHVQTDYLELVFAVFPSNRGGWNLQTIPEAGERQGKVLFPERWLGNPDAELGMTFCHPGNWLLSCNTKEECIAAARIAIAEFNK